MEFVPWNSFGRIVARYSGNARGSTLIPSYIHISEGTMGDVNVLDILPLEAGAFYILDRGYLDFARLHTMHQDRSLFCVARQVQFPRAERLFGQGR